ncbi:MAG: radical SAM protein [Gammaproteobacteria bacterium]|nr:MAG: radical SAM protein [Gammaproteobacteria bacterium]
MHATLPMLEVSSFPPIRRARLETLQINVGYRCNQSCVHCHVNAGPKRPEVMNRETAEQVIAFMHESGVKVLDITGGAPELNPNFRYLATSARDAGVDVIDRCNLTILSEPGQEDLAGFLAENRVEVTASMPCYLEENVERQRGKGVYARSLAGLAKLNDAGYGRPDSGLVLNLVYNPQGPSLPPPQVPLEADYRAELGRRGIVFNRLLTLANMPVGRFGSTLVSKGQFAQYMTLLRNAHQDENLDTVMCRSLVSVDWQGYLYDCDFNQMLELPLRVNGSPRVHVTGITGGNLEGGDIVVREHCFGCTAGQGSSCSGALR